QPQRDSQRPGAGLFVDGSSNRKNHTAEFRRDSSRLSCRAGDTQLGPLPASQPARSLSIKQRRAADTARWRERLHRGAARRAHDAGGMHGRNLRIALAGLGEFNESLDDYSVGEIVFKPEGYASDFERKHPEPV